MNKILTLLLFSVLVLSSCGGDSPTATPSKNLFSSWASDDGTEVMDLTGGTFGTTTYALTITSGERCGCSMSLGGTQSSATAVLSSCSYSGGGGGDPGCSGLNGSYTITNTAAKLTICGGGACTGYH